MNRKIFLSFPLVFMAMASNSFADTPAFDRPGISFSTTTIPPGSFSFEQGLPDFQHSSSDNVKNILYSTTTNLRIGLSKSLELQVNTALLNYLKVETPDVSYSINGYGDSSIAIKMTQPSFSRTLSWAILGGVTFAIGDAPFSEEATQYDLGTTINIDLNETFSTAFYINLTHSNNQSTYTFSPSLGFAATDIIGMYVEAGIKNTTQNLHNAVVGGGITWMITPIMQLDISANLGLNRKNTDIQGGFGISVFIE